MRQPQVIDEQAVELIAARVAASLSEQLQTLLGAVAPATGNSSMTVEQVAARLGVARSTVYAHWREWGGYKLGRGAKAPIRFDAKSLPHPAGESRAPSRASAPQPAKRPRGARRRALIADAPRLAQPLEEAA